MLRVLIVEDSDERQAVLRSLFRDHAWVLTHTAAHAIRLVRAFRFDLVTLDYDLAGPGTGEDVAVALAESRNATATVLVHSMNAVGASRISAVLPHAELLPLSRMVRTNATFKRLRSQLSRGPQIDWSFVFRASRPDRS